jgi:NTE family protein
MKHAFATIFFIFFSLLLIAQTRPKIGVTLSGGGAKGLAHIGILKAIDSAGLKVNYVTGTSMGSIIGGLYACGYSGDTIEKMARNTDWDLLLSNAASLRTLSIDEKDEYGKYAVELPWVNHAFQLPSGVFESEELWLRFSENFFPVYNVKDFSKLPKGFKCVATDVSTGEPVVIDSGEIVSAVRSSMAIPTVFTAVNYNGRKLIDGGVTRNFPVKDAKQMGADIVIGSNVAGGLLPKEKITNVFQVLLQVAFFREDADVAEEKKLCNIYVKHDLQGFSMGSFAGVHDIIKEGDSKGDSIYPSLKRMADSLNAIYGVEKYKVNNVPKVDSVRISAYEIAGLKNTNESFFLHRMEFEPNRWYTAKELTACIRKAFGTRYYNRIVYSLQPLPDGSCKIIFDVEENPLTFGKLGVHYNSFSGISLIGNLTTRDFFTPYSRSLITANIGENLRIKAEHLQSFGKFKTLTLATTLQAESMKFTTYDNFDKDGLYNRNYFVGDLNLHWNIKRKYSFGIGTRFEAFHYKPDITSKLEFRGSNNLFNSYVSLRLNTLSNAIYPKHGSKVDIEAGYVYSQHTDLDFYSDGNPITNPDSLSFNFNNFIKTKLNYEHYFPVFHKSTFFTQLQAGINFNQQESVLNDYFIGGLEHTFRNQITFAGLNEGTVLSSSAASLQLGLRYQMFNNLYLTAKANGLYYNFVGSNKNLQTPGWLTGYAVTLGYNFVLGPLEISAMYCDQSKKLLPYINLGIPF